jgi:hypothetical protein
LEAGLTTVNRPVDGQIEAEPASDPILNAGLQVARTQLASRQAP